MGQRGEERSPSALRVATGFDVADVRAACIVAAARGLLRNRVIPDVIYLPEDISAVLRSPDPRARARTTTRAITFEIHVCRFRFARTVMTSSARFRASLTSPR